MPIIQQFQTEARSRGLYHGEIDGDAGPLTVMAMQSFFGGKSFPRWMIWAARELGVSEISGPRANPRIVHYASFTTYGATSDEVAWCSSFVCAGLEEGAGVRSTRDAGAASYKTWGKPAPPGTYGAIGLKATTTGSHRHVFFTAGLYKGFVFQLGGNQSDQVRIAVCPVSEITESRLPK